MNDTTKALLLYLNGNNWTYEGFWLQGVIQRECIDLYKGKKKPNQTKIKTPTNQKRVFIIQSEELRLLPSWADHVEKCPQISFRKMITEQITKSKSLEQTSTLRPVKTD